jgi:CheY-like chemotaxis protein
MFHLGILLKHIPVVIVSALAFARDMFEKFPQVKHFLAKPFTPSDLMTIVHQSLPSGSSHG